MNNKVNYTLVGFLVILGFGMLFGFSYWLLKPSSDKETKDYIIYFDESVLGLNINAPVKYRGISVGKVVKIRINPKNSEQVEVLARILKSTPIKSDTVAKLTAQGITGLSYINLSLGKNSAPPLRIKDGDECPIIKSVPSFFENFENSLGTVSSKLSKTLSGTEKLLNDENQKKFSLILSKTALVMDKLDRLMDDKTIEHIHNSAKNLQSITHKTDALIPNVDTLVNRSLKFEDTISNSFDSIMSSYKGIDKTMKEFKKVVTSGQFNFKDMSADLIPTINNTLLQFQDLIVHTNSVINEYENSPRDILFKHQEIKKGPGEK